MNASVPVRQAASHPEWFATWFDSVHYHRLYAHRDDAEAAALISLLLERMRPVIGAEMLDLGCGTGRHARHLASSGFRVTGLDLSAASINEAKRAETSNLRFVRQDMRQPFGTSAFDYVLSLFTSFGYFSHPAEHLTVVHNIARALKPGGTVVLDYLNVRYAEARLTREEVSERDGVVYRLSRWTDADAMFKRIVVDDPRAASPAEYVERVAKLTLEDLRFMFALCDMRIEDTYGDYRLAPFDVDASERLILVARKIDGASEPGYLRDRFLRMRLTVSGVMPRYDASIV
jgi:SAM-dependent methyltransferase